MFNLFRICRKDEISFDIVAKNGNNIEATFDIKETLNLLLVWTGLNATFHWARKLVIHTWEIQDSQFSH